MQVRLWSGPIFNLSVTEPAAPKVSNLSGRHNFGNTKWPGLRRSDFGFDAKALLGPIRPPMPSWLALWPYGRGNFANLRKEKHQWIKLQNRRFAKENGDSWMRSN